MVFRGFRRLPSRAECFFLSFRILELELPAVCVGEIRYGMFGTRSQIFRVRIMAQRPIGSVSARSHLAADMLLFDDCHRVFRRDSGLFSPT